MKCEKAPFHFSHLTSHRLTFPNGLPVAGAVIRPRTRLRKYVVEDEVTQTVPVKREEVRVEREPITDANAGAATDGPAISEEEHEVVLHEEEVVTEKRAVPKERIRVDKETVTDEQQVSETVRSERIDVDDQRS